MQTLHVVTTTSDSTSNQQVLELLEKSGSLVYNIGHMSSSGMNCYYIRKIVLCII